MRKVIKVAATFAMSAICIGAFPLCGQAGINVSDSDITLEIKDENWKEISDKYSLHTFTNGTDVITVLKYGKDEELPKPEKIGEKYKAVYQTIYSAGDETYIVTGSAVRAEDICGVKEVIDSIIYPDMESDTGNPKTNTAHDGQDDNNNEDQNQSPSMPQQGWDSIVLYDVNMNSVYVTRGKDGSGNWYDENGISYGNLDEADENSPIYNENGKAYYWSGQMAQDAAEGVSGNTEEEPEVSDPYDLYSWDAETNSYVPYQQAAGNAQPIGRGNGWYYYDEKRGNYLPW